jgi:dephospho-CoA kinase
MQKLLGLTGNIATGKSEVARMLQQLGAQIIDADQVAREIVQPGEPALEAIVRVFGKDILNDDGSLHRKAMGQLVFRNAEKLKQLESITHPAVRERMWKKIHALPDDAIVVVEVIKLFESGWADHCDEVWVTNCSREKQVERLIYTRSMNETEAIARVEAQNPQSEKLKRADVVIDTSGTLEETRVQVLRAWQKLIRPY